IKTYGDVVHSFICDENYDGVFIPGFREDSETEYSFGFKFIDHIVGNVEKGQMNHWADFYADVFSFTQLVHFTDKDISTKYSALMSKVMQNSNRYIKFPINEPADGLNKSQIQEFLDYYGGPGSQHIALLTDDIVHTCTQMRNAGVEFLEIPDAYYDVLKERVGDIEEDIEILRQLGILVDRAGEGYLLQLFTKPVQDRPTLFYEIIQRKGSDGFGQGNFQALFDSIEHEQGLRGNL
ncbi:MAG: 4-hydroxyphenylpyruvate dioxygenase, partial [Candidatus Poseidoniia archaeon]|nr:4-hydroxyphenylpyruvate dioxygenase [Candidatus Poseidoniia archaeon]